MTRESSNAKNLNTGIIFVWQALLNNDRPLISQPQKPVMDIIGQAFNDDNWNDDLMPNPGPSGCNGCHQLSDGPRFAGQSSEMPPLSTSKYLKKPLPNLDDAEVPGLGLANSSLGWFNTGPKQWFHNTGTTPSYGTRPTSGSHGSNGYYYVETSRGYAYDEGDTAVLESDFFNPNKAYLKFDINLYGEDVGSVHVDVWQKSTFRWTDSIWSVDGQTYAGRDKQDFWLSREIDLDQFDSNGESIKLRFRVVANGGYKSDIAIDRLLVSRKIPIAIHNRADNTCLKIFGYDAPTSYGGDQLVTCDDNDESQHLFSWDMGDEKLRIGGDWTRDTGYTSDYCWFVENDDLRVQGCNPYFSSARASYLWQQKHLSNGYMQFVSEVDPAQCMSFTSNTDGTKSASLDICNPSDTKQQWGVIRKEKRLLQP